MLKRLQFLRGNTSATSSFTGLVGELTVNTSDWSIHVHDGSTAGGTKLATQDYVTGVASGIDAGQIASLTANAAVQSGLIANLQSDVSTLTSNAATQAGTLASLESNAAVQSGLIAGLTANAGAQASTLSTLTSNAAVQAGLIANNTSAITTANLAMKGYVDNSVTTANVGMKGYVDSVADRSIYGNSNVASYLPIYSGSIGANISKAGYTWTFGTDSDLTIPGDIVSNSSFTVISEIEGTSSGVYLDGTDGSGNVILFATNDSIIRSDNNGTFKDWIFGSDGTTTFPVGVSIDNQNGDPFVIIRADEGKSLTLQAQGNVSGGAGILWQSDNDFSANTGTASVGVSNSIDGRAKVTFQVTSYDPAGTANRTKTWTFDEDGTTTLPGVVKHSTIEKTGGAGSETSTALDLTKSVQVLVSADTDDDSWSLADGVEGQIMYFVPKGAGLNNHYINIANVRYFSEGGYTVGSRSWIPFQIDDNLRAEDWRSLAVAVFTDGAWNTDTSWFD